MSAAFGQRAAGLAAAALLAGVFAVALADTRAEGRPSGLPEPAVGPWGGWSSALVGVARGRPSGCGWSVGTRAFGVVHPVLPCGVQVFVQYRGTRALTRVVAHVPVPEGRQFDLTRRLADRLGLEGVRELDWTYAR